MVTKVLFSHSSVFNFGFPSISSVLPHHHHHHHHRSNAVATAGKLQSNIGVYKCRPIGLIVRASAKEDSVSSDNNLVPLAPLGLQSPTGQLLAQILQTNPHILPAAIDQQLENLETNRDSKTSGPSSKDVLYKRIAGVKEKERRLAVQDIMYCLIVLKFIDNEISMIPKISASNSDPIGRVDFWPNQEMKLESVHSPEALEMIQSHVSLVLGERLVGAGPLSAILEMSKIKLGKLYAASIMYGYFLRRVDERFQLERTMNTTLPEGFTGDQEPPLNPLWDPDSLIRIPADGGGRGGFFDNANGDEQGKSYRLRSYVMYLDAETLERYATIRSKEAVSLIENQTQALFGKPDIRITKDGSIDASHDQVVALTFSGLTMLVLEAVAFGSFLWDAETYAESKYHFLKS